MQLIHCTEKLLKELKQELTNDLPTNNYFGSWHANLLIIERHKCVLVTNDGTIYTLFIPYLKRADFQAFPIIFGQHLFKNLLHDGFSQAQIEMILNEHQDIGYAKTNNRRVLGTMNDLKFQVEIHVQMNGGLKYTDLYEVNRELNRTIFSVIEYNEPIEMLRAKFKENNT